MGNHCFSEHDNREDEDSKADSAGEPFVADYEKHTKINLQSFELLRVLGEGAFGKVYLVEKKDTRKVYAMKVLKKRHVEKRNQRFHTKIEREILATMECPFIVKLHYAFQTKDKLYLVMDFMPGGELFTHLYMSRVFEESRAKFYAAELLLALEYLHKRDIIYRDLKPENILLDAEGHLRITDFGLSKNGVNSNQKTYTLCGTPEYLAPEILLGQGHDQAVDFWSFGALLYEMLSGKPPFYHKDHQYMFKLVLEKKLEMKSYFSKEARSLLTQLLEKDPKERLKNAEEVKKHEFFKEIDWDELNAKTIKPPFRPKLKGSRDLRFFDKQFTERLVNSSLTPQSCVAGVGCTYTGFTFDPQNGPEQTPSHKKLSPSPRENELFEINPTFQLKAFQLG